MQPSPNISHLVEYIPLLRTSGAIYPGVPHFVPWKILLLSLIFASPKSAIETSLIY